MHSPKIIRRFLSLLALLSLATIGVRALRAAEESKLVYQQAETRQKSYEASLQASGLPVFGPWSQVGPFDAADKRPPPEKDFRPDASFKLLGGETGKWVPAPEYPDGYANTLDTTGLEPKDAKKKSTMFLRRTIVAPKPARVRLYLGCDTQFKAWLNGTSQLHSGLPDKLEAGQEVIDLTLKPGENVLTLRIDLTKSPCRLFVQPEFGEQTTTALLNALDRDFPIEAPRQEGYRQRAALNSVVAEDRYYRLEEIQPPPGVVIEGGGMGFLPDGRLALSTRRGFLYLIENLASGSPADIKFERFAQGLHEALGLGIVNGQIVVINRGELTRVLDTDGDNRADRFECLSNDWGLSGNYHEYAYGVPEDKDGNLYVALNLGFPREKATDVKYRGCVLRIKPDGKQELVCAGLRSPNGMGQNAAGDLFVTDNQGEWVAACPLYHIEQGHYYGHTASLERAKEVTGQENPTRTLPAVWFPYEDLSQSASDIECDTTGGKFGPFTGQLFVGEMTKGLISRVQLEKVNGKYQGTCFLFRRGCGAVNRLTFGPDGRLYFSRVNRGWGGSGLADGLARLEFTGRTPLEILSVHLIDEQSFELTFTKPLAEGVGELIKEYSLEQYGYNYWSKYGSPRTELTKLPITKVELARDRLSVKLTIEGLKAGKVCKFKFADLVAGDGDHLLHIHAFYTLNEFPKK